MTHTPEPWKVEGKNIIVTVANPRRSLLSVDHDGYATIFSEEDARRILACVNACKGLSTDNLENLLMLGDTLKARFESRLPAEAERDELIVAAKSVIRDALDRVEVHPCDEHDDNVKSRGLSAENRQLHLTIQRIEGK